VACRRIRVGLWSTALWGAPDAGDIAALTAAWNTAIDLGTPFASLIDASRVIRIDPDGFHALSTYLIRRRSAIERVSPRRAIVRPGGLAGAVAAGTLSVVGFTTPVGVFADVARAIEWLIGSGASALVTEHRKWLDELVDTPTSVAAVRAMIADDAPAELGRIAARLGMSPRTLQRQLRAAGTSFHAEVTSTRITRAKELLLGTEQKVAAVARRVGYRSEQHFIRLFRTATGATPARWRRLIATPAPA
jgi:AraC-like DNA-binding protein